MIRNINIENYALIKKQIITFDKGLNIITGETGSGKSILAGAISGIFGYDISNEQILHGFDTLKIQCEIELSDKKCSDIYNLTDIESDQNTYVISRTILEKGKNSIRLNGSIISVITLRQIGELIFDFHSQDETRQLLRKDNQVKLLDQFCEPSFSDVYTRYQQLYEDNKNIAKKIAKIKKSMEDKNSKKEFLTYQINEIESADIKEDEIQVLEKKKDLLVNSEKILRSFNNIKGSYSKEEIPVFDLCENIKTISSEFEFLSQYYDEFSKYPNLLNDIYWQLKEIHENLTYKFSTFDYDVSELDIVIERLDFIKRLQSKYGGSLNDIIERLNEMKDELEMIENSDSSIAGYENEFDENEKELITLENKIYKYRREAAINLSKEVKSELRKLDMPDVEFEVRFIKKDQKINRLYSNGNHEVRFAISTNKGQPLKYLDEISSGGEMARVMLVFKNLISIFDDTDILVFDEIESGISGSTAFKVGRKIFDISNSRQVICITHIPQIAVFSKNHYKVTKKEDNDFVYSYVYKLDYNQKVDEIAKLLGSSKVSEKALMNSTELIKAACEYINVNIESE